MVSSLAAILAWAPIDAVWVGATETWVFDTPTARPPAETPNVVARLSKNVLARISTPPVTLIPALAPIVALMVGSALSSAKFTLTAPMPADTATVETVALMLEDACTDRDRTAVTLPITAPSFTRAELPPWIFRRVNVTPAPIAPTAA